MAIRAKAHVATLTRTNGKERIVFVHIDREYVWDKIFEHLETAHGADILPDDTPRRKLKAIATNLGYKVRRGLVTVED